MADRFRFNAAAPTDHYAALLLETADAAQKAENRSLAIIAIDAWYAVNNQAENEPIEYVVIPD